MAAIGISSLLTDNMVTTTGPRRGSLKPHFKALSQRGNRPVIDVTLNDQQSGYVNAYTTHDKIEGEVSITALQDIRYTDIIVTFEGTSNTYVERIATGAPTSGRTEARHNFLKLTQPIDRNSLSEPTPSEAGPVYKIPFTFVVPESLLPQVCAHRKTNFHLHHAHLQLPPSLADPMLSSDGSALLNDMAPEMSKISYRINVKIVRYRESDGKPTVIAESAKKLRIVPATEDQPPLNIAEDDGEYHLRKEKDVRKGMFKGKSGRLSIEASQPHSIRLPAPRSGATTPPTTTATVHLRFDPADEATQPPRLGSLLCRLKVATFFSSTAMRDFPSRSTHLAYDLQKGLFPETLSLASRNVASAQWERHASLGRRDSSTSTSSSDSTPEASDAYDGKSFYTAKIIVPLSLPKNRVFVPTFHSCLISRTYALDLNLSYSGPHVSSSNISVRLPLQIVSEGDHRPADVEAHISAEEAEAIAAREIDRDFQPRSVAPPSPEYTEAALMRTTTTATTTMSTGPDAPAASAPPGYSFWAPPAREEALLSSPIRVG